MFVKPLVYLSKTSSTISADALLTKVGDIGIHKVSIQCSSIDYPEDVIK